MGMKTFPRSPPADLQQGTLTSAGLQIHNQAGRKDSGSKNLIFSTSTMGRDQGKLAGEPHMSILAMILPCDNFVKRQNLATMAAAVGQTEVVY